MIRLMIVDDEPVARQGIRQAIDWGGIGVKVVGEAENGETALAGVQLLHPDLILCDVRMPVMDGVALIRELHRTMPSIHVIMLSAYADSEYMLEAIRSGVCDYLMKPAGKEQIKDSVMSACERISASRERDRQAQARQSLIHENMDALRSLFFENLLSGHDGSERLLEQARLLDLPLRGKRHAFVLTGFNGKNPGTLMFDCERAFVGMSTFVSRIPRMNGLCLLLSIDRQTLDDIAAAIKESRLAESPRHSGIFVLSPLCDSLVELRDHFPKLISLLHRSMWYGDGEVVRCDRERLPLFPRLECESIENRLMDSIREGDSDASMRGFEELLTLLGKARAESTLLQPIFRRVFESMRIVNGAELDPNCVLEETPQGLREHFARLCSASRSMQSRFGGGSLGRALRYLARKYADNISLESMASELCISPSYLSRMLNEKTDKGFQGWLHFFRIEKAKVLLVNTTMKNYDIAAEVGFGSYKAFAEHFHACVGMTAKEYRARHAGNVEAAPDTPMSP